MSVPIEDPSPGKTAVEAMRKAQANMSAVLGRNSTLEMCLVNQREVLRHLKTILGPSVRLRGGKDGHISAHEYLDDEIARITKAIG